MLPKLSAAVSFSGHLYFWGLMCRRNPNRKCFECGQELSDFEKCRCVLSRRGEFSWLCGGTKTLMKPPLNRFEASVTPRIHLTQRPRGTNYPKKEHRKTKTSFGQARTVTLVAVVADGGCSIHTKQYAAFAKVPFKARRWVHILERWSKY